MKGKASTLNNLGIAYKKLGDIHRAIGYYEQSLSIKQAIGDRRGEKNTIENLIKTHLLVGDRRRVIEYYEHHLAIISEIGNVNDVASDLLKMAGLYLQEGDNNRALLFATNSARLFSQIDSPKAQHAYELIVQLQGDTLAPHPNTAQAAFEAFQLADTLQVMQTAAAQYPMLKDGHFIQTIQKIIIEQVSPEYKPAFEQRLTWLKQIVGK